MTLSTLTLLASLAAATPTDPVEAIAAGRPALVTFWASWCQPCRTELPRLDALQQRLDPARGTVVAVNLDRSSRTGQAVYDRLGLGLPVVWDPDGVVAIRFDPTALPATFLVDADGAIVETWLGELDADGVREAEARLAALSRTP